MHGHDHDIHEDHGDHEHDEEQHCGVCATVPGKTWTPVTPIELHLPSYQFSLGVLQLKSFEGVKLFDRSAAHPRAPPRHTA